MLQLYKAVFIGVSTVFILTIFSISVYFNLIYYRDYALKDDRVQAVEVILKNPALFKIPVESLKVIDKYYTDYKNIKEENLSTYKDYGISVSMVKNECLTRALGLVGNSLTQDFRAYRLFTIGGLSHGILAYAVDMERNSNAEVEIYMNNIRKIMDAVPKNLPHKDILIKKPINTIEYYVDYAKIIYDIDKQIDSINHETGTTYYGKRFENSLKGEKK